MGKSGYIGIGDVAKKVKNVYIGDETGVAKKVKKGFVGVSNVAKEWWASTPVDPKVLIMNQGSRKISYSTNNGSTWTAGANIPSSAATRYTPAVIGYSGEVNKWVSVDVAGETVYPLNQLTYYSVNPPTTAWTATNVKGGLASKYIITEDGGKIKMYDLETGITYSSTQTISTWGRRGIVATDNGSSFHMLYQSGSKQVSYTNFYLAGNNVNITETATYTATSQYLNSFAPVRTFWNGSKFVDFVFAQGDVHVGVDGMLTKMLSNLPYDANLKSITTCDVIVAGNYYYAYSVQSDEEHTSTWLQLYRGSISSPTSALTSLKATVVPYSGGGWLRMIYDGSYYYTVGAYMSGSSLLSCAYRSRNLTTSTTWTVLSVSPAPYLVEYCATPYKALVTSQIYGKGQYQVV